MHAQHPRTVTDQLQHDLHHALDLFVARIVQLVQHAAIEAIQAAVVPRPVGTSGHHGMAVDDCAPPMSEYGLHRAPPTDPDHRGTPLVVARASDPVEQLVAFIREHPGSSTREIGRSLGVRRTKLRPQLRKLVADGVIRREDRPIGQGARKYPTYVVPGAAPRVPVGMPMVGMPARPAEAIMPASSTGSRSTAVPADARA